MCPAAVDQQSHVAITMHSQLGLNASSPQLYAALKGLLSLKYAGQDK
jgi:hypothetical protein